VDTPGACCMEGRLNRLAVGDVECLILRLPTGEPVAKGGVDFVARPGAGTIFQLATRNGLEGLGLTSRLIAVLEVRVRQRDLHTARLSVEPHNIRAWRLHQHLGYQEGRQRRASWEAEVTTAPASSTKPHSSTCTKTCPRGV